MSEQQVGYVAGCIQPTSPIATTLGQREGVSVVALEDKLEVLAVSRDGESHILQLTSHFPVDGGHVSEQFLQLLSTSFEEAVVQFVRFGDGALKLDCTAMQSSQQRSVHELLQEKLSGPLEGNWMVTAAQINLYYPPDPGKTRMKVVPIEITSKGRLNLHKFDARMQAQLERYLVSVGILQNGQTLSAHESPPETGEVDPEPVVES